MVLRTEENKNKKERKKTCFFPKPFRELFIYVLWFSFILGLNFCFLLFLDSVMYDNERIMSLKQKKRKIQTNDKIELPTYVTFLFSSVSLDTGNVFFFDVMMSTIRCNNLLFCLSIIAWRFSSACVVEANTFYSNGTKTLFYKHYKVHKN